MVLLKRSILYLFVFLSGLTGLAYQVLWMKQLGLLFGNTAHAASATLAAFFGGLALGSWFWGRRVARVRNVLKTYAALELGIAAGALLYFVVLSAYYRIYPGIYQGIEGDQLRLLIKFVLAVILVFPPSFCMGGTIPVIGQYLIRHQTAFGHTSALLYGVNTLGAALGAGLAGFFFPLWLGFRMTCVSAMGVTLLIALGAWLLSRSDSGRSSEYIDEKRDGESHDVAPSIPQYSLTTICFLSGFGFLALEVLWTRMFAQVLENSVYTYASILVIVLICLSLGAAASSTLARVGFRPERVLLVLLVLSGMVISAMPFAFMSATNDLEILAIRGTWGEYISHIFQKGFYSIGGAALVLGMVFPYLMKIEESRSTSAGASLGRLAAINTAGAILGAIACGFVFLEWLGMWRTTQLLAVLYTVAAIAMPGWRGAERIIKIGAVVILALQCTALDPSNLPVNSIDPERPEETVLETWEASDCTVAVTRGHMGLTIKVNSHYGLGSTGAFMQQKLQTDIPLMIEPETKSIVYLGMGTGITAGQALVSQFATVERVVVCELIQQVIDASRKYMTDVEGQDATAGLFTDERATVLAEDGRHYLLAASETFDMINADLFVPFRSGAGSLYTREHFESARNRLSEDGLFVQWLPLYQVTENEFMIITKTMLEVFEQVSLWRHSFQPGEEVVALVGHKSDKPLPANEKDLVGDRIISISGRTHHDLMSLALPFDPETILLFYGGNVTKAAKLFESYPVNTDDRPLIEYMAPRTYRKASDVSTPWFVGPRIARLIEAVQAECPPDEDPLLVNRSAINRRLPAAGTAYYRARLWQVIGDENACARSWFEFVREWTNQP